MDIVVGGARRVLLSLWVCDLMRRKKKRAWVGVELQGDPDQLSRSDILQSLSETTVHRNVNGSRKKKGTSEGRKGKGGAEMKEAGCD